MKNSVHYKGTGHKGIKNEQSNCIYAAVSDFSFYSILIHLTA